MLEHKEETQPYAKNNRSLLSHSHLLDDEAETVSYTEQDANADINSALNSIGH